MRKRSASLEQFPNTQLDGLSLPSYNIKKVKSSHKSKNGDNEEKKSSGGKPSSSNGGNETSGVASGTTATGATSIPAAQEQPKKGIFRRFLGIFRKSDEEKSSPVEEEKRIDTVESGGQGEMQSEVELSLCADKLISAQPEDFLRIFEENKVSFENFKSLQMDLLSNPNLIVRIENDLYDWKSGMMRLISLLVYKQPLFSEEESTNLQNTNYEISVKIPQEKNSPEEEFELEGLDDESAINPLNDSPSK